MEKFIRKKLAEYSQTGLESTHQCTEGLGSISCVYPSSSTFARNWTNVLFSHSMAAILSEARIS